MWLWAMPEYSRDPAKVLQGSNYLRLQRGQPTVYERFLANVKAAGLSSMVMPLRVSSIVGMRLLQHLYAHGRLSHLPQAMYIDSAHELGETMQELWIAWQTLPDAGGVLYGDDFQFKAVLNDVAEFVNCVSGSAAGTSYVGQFVDQPGLQFPHGKGCVPYDTAESIRGALTKTYGDRYNATQWTLRFCSAVSSHEFIVYRNQWVIIKAAGERKIEGGRGYCQGLAPAVKESFHRR